MMAAVFPSFLEPDNDAENPKEAETVEEEDKSKVQETSLF